MENKQLNDKLEEINSLLNDNLLSFIRSGEFPKKNNQNFFLTIYNFVENNGNKDEEASCVYNYYKNIINEFAVDFANKVKNRGNNKIIDIFIDLSNRMDILIFFMKQSFSYLDFYYTKNSPNSKNLEVLAQDIYKTILFNPFVDELIGEINKLIKDDRNGKVENRQKLKRILGLMKAMDLSNPKIVKEKNSYKWINIGGSSQDKTLIQDRWFSNFSEDTLQFSSNKAKKDIQKFSTPEYVLEELKYLKEEEERQKEFINEIYYGKINEINFKEIIGKNMEELVDMESGVKNMLENKKFDELSNLYILFKNYEPSLNEISRIFIPYIHKRANAIIDNKETKKDPKKLVPELIILQKEMNDLVLKCFNNDSILQIAENKAFTDFMKKEFYSKQIAYFLDYCMRTYFKGKSQEEIDKTLDDIINLVRNLSSKYFFQKESEKKLSERLIKGQTLSENFEKSFISKFGQEMGISMVNKMTSMMNDLEENKKELINYRNTSSKGFPNGIKFNVQVISYSSWEINMKNIIKLNLPPLFKSCVDDFENYYISRHKENKLFWCFGISNVEIQFLYLKNKNISTSTLLQILALLEIEKNGFITAKKLSEKLECNIDILLNHFDGLMFNPSYNIKCEKDKGVVIAKNNGKIDENTEFSINNNFISQRIKFNTMPMPKKKTEEQEKQEEEIEAKNYKRYQDFIIQATLTRIMKSRIGQETTHNWLVTESAKQIDIFKAQPSQIKENIEKLIEKNYIKRSEQNRNCYEYIA